jgi:phosphate transport system permease protein
MTARIARRNRAESRFRRLGLLAIVFAIASLGILLATILHRGAGAFVASDMQLEVTLDRAEVEPLVALSTAQRDEALAGVDLRGAVKSALRARFPEVTARKQKRELSALASRGAANVLRAEVLADPASFFEPRRVWLPTDDEVDLYRKVGEPGRLSEGQVGWVDSLDAAGALRSRFNWAFLSNGDSREPELAGVLGATVGSLLTLIVTLLIVFPLGVSAAVYLEEFAPKGRWTDLIEVNINNLAAVPSIVFGLLGLAAFLNFMNLPRSAPLVGGLTLALMTLPTLIITSRVAIQAVPPSIREAARGLGASPLQVVAHHVIPLALPGILTGTIIGMARALGETAPLLMIGMVAFVVDVPGGLTDASTALPVQIFLWADSPERAFVEKTSGAILVLLGFLILMNGTAIAMRKRFEKRW